MPAVIWAQSACIPLCTVAAVNLHQLCTHTCTRTKTDMFTLRPFWPNELDLQASWPSLFSNQHIPLSLDTRGEDFGSGHIGWGNAHILSPDLRLHTHTHTQTLIQSCTVFFFFSLIPALQTPQSCSPNVQLFLCFEAAVIVPPVSLGQPQSQRGRASPTPVVMSPHRQTLLCPSITTLLPSLPTPPSPPLGHCLGSSVRLDWALSPTTMRLQSATINFLLIAALACLSVSVFPTVNKLVACRKKRNKTKETN